MVLFNNKPMNYKKYYIKNHNNSVTILGGGGGASFSKALILSFQLKIKAISLLHKSKDINVFMNPSLTDTKTFYIQHNTVSQITIVQRHKMR